MKGKLRDLLESDGPIDRLVGEAQLKILADHPICG